MHTLSPAHQYSGGYPYVEQPRHSRFMQTEPVGVDGDDVAADPSNSRVCEDVATEGGCDI
jgi:hypothetical protein